MTTSWAKARWGDLVTLEYGRSLRNYRHTTGRYQVFGTNGPIGSHDKPLCQHPTVVVGRKGANRGIHYSPEPCFVIDTAFYLKPKTNIDIRWAYYQLLTIDLNGMDSGSAIPSTSREAFYQLPVSVPPIHQQEEIACILGTLDDKIELNRCMSRTLEEIVQALFKSWFVDFDPVHAKSEGRDPQLPKPLADLFPDRFVDSELGLIPVGWSIRKFGDVVDVVGGTTPSTKVTEYWGNTHCWATPKDLAALTAPVLLDTERKITDFGLNQIGSGLLPRGTLLLSCRAPIGYMAISEVEVAINQGFIAMLPTSEVPPLFLLNWCSSFHHTIVEYANGSTFLEISKRNLRRIDLVVPSERVLTVFIMRVRQLYDRMVSNAHETRNLSRMRNALLAQLILEYR